MSHIAHRGVPATTGTTLALRVALATLIVAGVIVARVFVLRGGDGAAATPKAIPYAHVARPDEGLSTLRPITAPAETRAESLNRYYARPH